MVFGAFGEVTNVSLPMRHGFGFVTFGNRVSANDSSSNMDGTELDREKLRVSMSKFQAASSEEVSSNIETKDLAALFSFCQMFPDDLAEGYSRAVDAIQYIEAEV